MTESVEISVLRRAVAAYEDFLSAQRRDWLGEWKLRAQHAAQCGITDYARAAGVPALEAKRRIHNAAIGSCPIERHMTTTTKEQP